ncbi:MAG: hypothetical protein AAB113_03895 [Candidatus Eisenbacteria bacterium]
MTTTRLEWAAFDSARRLGKSGFEGFRSVSHLRLTSCAEVPVARGVYLVVRDTDQPPEFLPRSVGGWFRRQDPTVALDELTSRWVAGARVLYLGRACGPGVRSLLQQRVKRCIRFGQGKAVGHRGGRLIWQLRDHLALRFAWKPTPDEDPAPFETGLQAAFVAQYGRLPFANLRQEDGE